MLSQLNRCLFSIVPVLLTLACDTEKVTLTLKLEILGSGSVSSDPAEFACQGPKTTCPPHSLSGKDSIRLKATAQGDPFAAWIVVSPDRQDARLVASSSIDLGRADAASDGTIEAYVFFGAVPDLATFRSGGGAKRDAGVQDAATADTRMDSRDATAVSDGADELACTGVSPTVVVGGDLVTIRGRGFIPNNTRVSCDDVSLTTRSVTESEIVVVPFLARQPTTCSLVVQTTRGTTRCSVELTINVSRS